MSAALPKTAEKTAEKSAEKSAENSIESPSLEPSCRDTAAHALSIVRDGVITGEGPIF